MDALKRAELRRLLRLLVDEPEADPMLPRLLEMYREWCRTTCITIGSERQLSWREVDVCYQWKMIVFGVAAVAWLFGCTEDTTQFPSAGAQGEADLAAIHAFFEQYDRTFRAGAGEEFMSLLSNDVILMAPNRPAMVGKNAVREGVRFLFENLDMDHVVTVDEVRLSDDWAYVRATYTFRGTPKTGGKAVEHLGKAAYLLERQPDNSWRIARDCYNTDHPTAD